MEKRLQVMITFVFLILLVAGLYIFTNWFSIITGYFTGESQQKAFGKSFEQIIKVDCGNDKENCPNVREVPAWYIPNSEEKFHYGLLTLNEISESAGCEPRT